MGSRRHRFFGKGTMKLHLITILAVWSCAEWGRVDGSNYPPNMPNIPSFDPRGAQHNNAQEEAAYVETAEDECCPCNEREQQSHGGGYSHNSKHGGYGYASPGGYGHSYGGYGYGGLRKYGGGYGKYGRYGNHGYKSHYGGGYGYGYPSYGSYGYGGGYKSYGKGYGGGYGGYGNHKFGGYGGYGGLKFGGYGGYGGHKFGGYGGYGGGYGNSDSDHTADEDEH